MRPTSFLPTPSARRATSQLSYRSIKISISTHALREEGDETADNTYNVYDDFYPRPPRGGRPCTGLPAFRPMRFLPTPSARRATYFGRKKAPPSSISTHALREEGDPRAIAVRAKAFQFLPTPSARRATRGEILLVPSSRFLPTPSARRATHRLHHHAGRQRISTHALREEGDPDRPVLYRGRGYFYPRPPRGGRLGCLADLFPVGRFLPTPSARRATYELSAQHGAGF